MRDYLDGIQAEAEASDQFEEPADTDAVRAYFKQVGRVPLLTAEQERALFQRIEKARHELARAVARRRGAQSSAEVRAASARLEALKEQAITANLRLVISVAKRYGHSSVSFLDRIQDGNLGLLDAIDRFDYRRGFKFSTYAVWWIRRAILRGMALNARTIRLPGQVLTALNRVAAARAILRRDLGRDPTVTELAAQMGMLPERVEALLVVGSPPVDLDAPVAEGTALGEFFADEQSTPPDGELDAQDHERTLREIMTSLNERERLVIRHRFGLDDTRPETLEQLAQRLHISRERVRQIEKLALARLRKQLAVAA